MIDGFIFMMSFCIFINVFLQKRKRYLESVDYKKYTNPKKEIKIQYFSVLSNYLLYISISMILLRLICIWVLSGEIRSIVAEMWVSLSVVIWALFIMMNSWVILYAPINPTNTSMPGFVFKKQIDFVSLLINLIACIILLSFLGKTIKLIFKLF